MPYNAYVVVPFVTWAIAQICKFSLAAIRGRVDFKYLYASGGMPSVHSAVVGALAVTALARDGADGYAFGFSLLFAAIVMYDSFGVRRASGDHAAALNMIIESLEQGRVRLQEPKLKLREILGHNPAEVLAGALLGVVTGSILNANYLSEWWSWLAQAPMGWEFWLYVGGFSFIVVAGWVLRLVIGYRNRDSTTVRRLARQILTKTQVVGWLGLAQAAAVYQELPYVSWRAWSLMIVAGLVAWDVRLLRYWWQRLPMALAVEADSRRKQQWLSESKTKKARRPKRR